MLQDTNTQKLSPEEQAAVLEAQTLKFAMDALNAITTREQEFQKGWWVQAKKAECVYTAEDEKVINQEPYNILYSNTEVLLPSLYSATPKPDVRGRFKADIKPLPQALDRFLTVAADPASPGGDCFDNAMHDAVLSALVQGMGFVRIRYVEDRSFPLTYESGYYENLIWGKATRWAKVPWIAFRHPMKREVMLKQFGIDAETAQLNMVPSDSEEDKDDCTVWEFWDKATNKVYFLSEEWQRKQLRVTEDPLGMENFYPTPGLLCMTMRSGKMLPIPLFNYYRNQADELNRVTVRLNKVLAAIKVRGVYNGLLGEDLKKLLSDADTENALEAATEAGLLAQNGGFDKQIWMLPIEKLIVVATQLYQARESIKQVIYEITGISDIIRGSSVASETATAQDLKAKWGTVRLRRMQTVVSNYARDLFRMSVDCGSDHISPDKWKAITQLPIPTQAEQIQARQQLEHEQALAAAQQMPGMPPQPPQPPNPALMAAAQSPVTWETLLAKIKNDLNRTYVVNIQTSSTIDLDTAQDKSEVTEFMNAMGQLMAPLGGLVTLGPTGMEAAKAILIAVCQRFKFGIDIAEVIAKVQAPPPAPPENKGPPPPTPAELQAIEQEAQSKILVAQNRIQVSNAETALALKKAENDQIRLTTDQQLMGYEIQQAQLRLEEQRVKLAAQKAKPAPAPASKTPAN